MLRVLTIVALLVAVSVAQSAPKKYISTGPKHSESWTGTDPNPNGMNEFETQCGQRGGIILFSPCVDSAQIGHGTDNGRKVFCCEMKVDEFSFDAPPVRPSKPSRPTAPRQTVAEYNADCELNGGVASTRACQRGEVFPKYAFGSAFCCYWDADAQPAPVKPSRPTTPVKPSKPAGVPMQSLADYNADCELNGGVATPRACKSGEVMPKYAHGNGFCCFWDTNAEPVQPSAPTKPVEPVKPTLPSSSSKTYDADCALLNGEVRDGEVCPAGVKQLLKPRPSFFDQGKKVCCLAAPQPVDIFESDCTLTLGAIFDVACPRTHEELFTENGRVCCRPKKTPKPVPVVPKEEFPPFEDDCTNNNGFAFPKACPKGFKQLFADKGQVCCEALPRPQPPKPTTPKDDFPPFDVDCTSSNGIVADRACPRAHVELFAENGKVCCRPNPKPTPIKPEPVSEQPNLDDFITDSCTAKGGITWDACSGGQVTLHMVGRKSCCGDPLVANRNAYRAYAKKCFDRSGFIYINVPCNKGAKTLIPQQKFGQLQPTVCCSA